MGTPNRRDPRTPDGVYVIRPDGRGRRLVTRKELDRPAFSPSGELVAAGGRAGPHAHHRLRPARRERRASFPAPDYPITMWPAWGATGRLALTVAKDGERGVGISRR